MPNADDEWLPFEIPEETEPPIALEFEAEAIEWRGPAPFVFVPVPAALVPEIKAASSRLTYGWGVIPAAITIGATRYASSLFPKDGGYLVPVKVAVQRAEKVGVGDRTKVRLDLGPDAAKRG